MQCQAFANIGARTDREKYSQGNTHREILTRKYSQGNTHREILTRKYSQGNTHRELLAMNWCGQTKGYININMNMVEFLSYKSEKLPLYTH